MIRRVWAFFISAFILLVILADLWITIDLWIKVSNLAYRVKELEYDRAHDEEWSDDE